jgi:hypothetical protein
LVAFSRKDYPSSSFHQESNCHLLLALLTSEISKIRSRENAV